MGATEEQMALLSSAHVTHVSYILILYSLAFLLFLYVAMLLHLYAVQVWPATPPKPNNPNGTLQRPNGHLERRIHDAEEFELQGLISEDDDNPHEGKTGSRFRDGSE